MIAIARPSPEQPTPITQAEERHRGPTPRWWPLREHATQIAALTCGQRFVFIDAGRRSGKTDIAKRFLVRHLPIKKPWPDPRYFYALPTRDWAKRVAWEDFQKLIPAWWIEGGWHGRNVSHGELWIRTRWGSTLNLLGMDEPSRVEGSPWDGGVLDEMSDQKPGCFDLHVRPALDTVENGVNREGWAWMIGKPSRQGVGATWFKKACEMCRRGEYTDGAAFTWPAWDILPAAAVAQARETLDPKDFNEQYGACWESAGGAVYHSFDRAYNVRPCGYNPAATIIVGSDFNVDPMCWCLSHRYGNRLETFDEIRIRNTNTQATLDVLAGRYGSHRGGWQFYGDSSWAQARKTSAALTDYAQINNDQRFVKMGRTLHYGAANPPLRDRFAASNALLCNAAQERRAFVDPRCRSLIDDLENLSYKTGTSEVLTDKIKVQNAPGRGHMSDAWGYVVHRLFPIIVDTGGTGEVILGSVGR